MDYIEAVFESVIKGDASAARGAVGAGLGAGLAAERILEEGLIAAMTEVGARFERQELYVPECSLPPVPCRAD